jgi:hypothetical protein
MQRPVQEDAYYWFSITSFENTVKEQKAEEVVKDLDYEVALALYDALKNRFTQ